MNEAQRRAYEDDLAAVLGYLDDPPEPGSTEDQQLARLVERVERAEAELAATEPDATPPAKAAEVRERLAALRAITDPQARPRVVERAEDATLGTNVAQP